MIEAYRMSMGTALVGLAAILVAAAFDLSMGFPAGVLLGSLTFDGFRLWQHVRRVRQ